MNYAKRTLAMLSSCLLAAFCTVAFAAAPAQAAGNWRVEGKNIAEKVEFEGEKDSSSYPFLVPSLGIELVFENFSIDSGILSTEGKGTAKLLFTGGKLFSKGELVPSCPPGDLLFDLKMNLFLHNGKTYLHLEPASGTTMTITTYGEKCALLETNEVTGSMVLETVSESFEGEAVKHLVRQTTAGGLFSGKTMLFGEHPMNLDGSWWMKLKGKHAGQKWSGVG